MRPKRSDRCDEDSYIKAENGRLPPTADGGTMSPTLGASGSRRPWYEAFRSFRCTRGLVARFGGRATRRDDDDKDALWLDDELKVRLLSPRSWERGRRGDFQNSIESRAACDGATFPVKDMTADASFT